MYCKGIEQVICQRQQEAFGTRAHICATVCSERRRRRRGPKKKEEGRQTDIPAISRRQSVAVDTAPRQLKY